MKDGRESDVAARLAEVQARVAEAAAHAGRAASAVTIVGVTKGVERGLIEAAVSAGLTELGENRIQEWLPKAKEVSLPVNWHFVGSLQTNKARYLRRGVKVLHSLDRESLLQALAERWRSWAAGLGRLAQTGQAHPAGLSGPVCLVQVNVADETTKGGLAPDEVEAFLEQVARTGVVKVGGLMTIAPYVTRAEEVRWVFARMREIRDAAQQRVPELDLAHLSMGMSGDYEVAIEEGATIVRVGTAIFGPRD